MRGNLTISFEITNVTKQIHKAVADINQIGDVQHSDTIIVVALIEACVEGQFVNRIDPAQIKVVSRTNGQICGDERKGTSCPFRILALRGVAGGRTSLLEEVDGEIQLVLEGDSVARVREDAEESTT